MSEGHDVETSGRLRETVAVVTGAGSGIGRAIAERFAREGAVVACVDLRGEAAQATAESLPGGARGYAADVTDEEQISALFALLERDLGPVGVLAANAGMAGPVGPIEEVALVDWNSVVAVNLTGVFLCAKHAVPSIRRNGGGAIVVTASNAAVVHEPGWTAYASTKAGAAAFARSLAVDLIGTGIRVNAICPGAIDTPLLRGGYQAELGDAALTMELPDSVGTTDKVASIVAFLASEEASLVNGATLVADGGSSARMGMGFSTQI